MKVTIDRLLQLLQHKLIPVNTDDLTRLTGTEPIEFKRKYVMCTAPLVLPYRLGKRRS